MEIKIGHIDKRINSTKHKCTWTTPGGYVDVKLKEPTTIDKPVFILLKEHWRKNEQGESVLVYRLDPKKDNWIYVDEWKSYYWVDQVEYTTNDIVTLYCHRDVLASSIDMLKDATAMVRYADLSHWDKYLDDIRFQPDYKLTGCEVVSAGTINNYIKWGEGCIVLTTLTYTSNTDTGYVTYLLRPDQFLHVLTGMYTTWDEIAQIKDPSSLADTGFFAIMSNLIYSFGSDSDPAKMIAGVKWLPMSENVLKDAINDTYGTGSLNTVHEVKFGGIVQTLESGDIAHAFKDEIMDVIRSDEIWNNTTHPSQDTEWIMPKSHPGYSKIPWLNGTKYLSVKFTTPSGVQEVNDNDLFMYIFALHPKWAMGLPDCLYTLSYCAVEMTSASPLMITNEELVISASGDVSVDLSSLIHSDIGNVVSNSLRSGLNIGLGALKLGTELGAASDAGKVKNVQTSVTTTVEDKKITRNADKQINGISTTTRATTDHTYVEKGTGILNSLSMGKMTMPQSPNISTNGTYASMYANNFYKVNNKKVFFSFVSTYSIPSLLAGNPAQGAQTVQPTAQEIYDRYEAFCALHGWPCSRVLKLDDIKTEGSYLETAWLSLGKSNLLLTPNEICELNSFLNGGIYLEDWKEETPGE